MARRTTVKDIKIKMKADNTYIINKKDKHARLVENNSCMGNPTL